MNQPFSPPPFILQMKGCEGWPGTSESDGTSVFTMWFHTWQGFVTFSGWCFSGDTQCHSRAVPNKCSHWHSIPVCCQHTCDAVLPPAFCSCCYNLSYFSTLFYKIAARGHDDERGVSCFKNCALVLEEPSKLTKALLLAEITHTLDFMY